MSDGSHISARNRARLLLTAAVLVIAAVGVGRLRPAAQHRRPGVRRDAVRPADAHGDARPGDGRARVRADPRGHLPRAVPAGHGARSRAPCARPGGWSARTTPAAQLDAQAAVAQRWHRLADAGDPVAADPSRPALRPEAGRGPQARVRPLPRAQRRPAPRPGGRAPARAQPRGRGLGGRDHPAGAAVRRPRLRGHRAPVAPRAGAPRARAPLPPDPGRVRRDHPDHARRGRGPRAGQAPPGARDRRRHGHRAGAQQLRRPAAWPPRPWTTTPSWRRAW